MFAGDGSVVLSCRIPEVQQPSFISSCLFSGPRQSKLVAFLLVQNSQKPRDGSNGSKPSNLRVFHGLPWISSSLSWLLLRWLIGSVGHVPIISLANIAQLTLRVLSHFS